MAKILALVLMLLFAALIMALGGAAETSRAALAVVVTIFAVALGIPASLAVGLLLERRKPRIVNHHVHQHLHVHQAAETTAPPPQVGTVDQRLLGPGEVR